MHFFVAKTIATALVNSTLDYCNSIKHNIVFKEILKLQRVQNCLEKGSYPVPSFSAFFMFMFSKQIVGLNENATAEVGDKVYAQSVVRLFVWENITDL